MDIASYLPANWLTASWFPYVKWAAIYFGGFLLTFYALWIHFLAVMKLQDNKDKLTGPNLFLGKIALTIGLLLDLFWQMIPATILWLELPRELTVSARVARLCEHGSGYRQKLAIWFRYTWLAMFDLSGAHGEATISRVPKQD